MAIVGKPGEYGHNDPNRAFVDSDGLRGGWRTQVTALTDLYAMEPKSDQLKERSTVIYVTKEDAYFSLIDMANISNANGWKVVLPGSLALYLNELLVDDLAARNAIAISHRKKNIKVEYEVDGSIVTMRYIADLFDDDSWQNDDNWEQQLNTTIAYTKFSEDIQVLNSTGVVLQEGVEYYIPIGTTVNVDADHPTVQSGQSFIVKNASEISQTIGSFILPPGVVCGFIWHDGDYVELSNNL